MISNLRFFLWGIPGLVLLAIPYLQVIYPRMVREAAIAEIERCKAIPYEKPRNTIEFVLPNESKVESFPYLVTMDTTFFFRNQDQEHEIMEINFGKNYLKTYDTNQEPITYALLDEETKEHVDAPLTLGGRSLTSWYATQKAGEAQEYYLRIIYQCLKKKESILDPVLPEKAPMELKILFKKNRWGRKIRDKRGAYITSLDTPKVVRSATYPLDITKQ